MAISQTFYLNASTLASSTSVFTNSTLTVLAADGFYSDGTIVRQQVGGVLLPAQPCPGCSVPCGTSVISTTSDGGVFMIPEDTGAATGAIIIRFNPLTVPVGIQAVFNSVTYNKLVSPVYGVLEGSASLPTYIGKTASDCGIVAGSPHGLDDYVYDGSSFVTLGTTSSVNVTAPEVQTTVAEPGDCVMVIPKTTATPSAVDVTIIAICAASGFNLTVLCPASLDMTDCTDTQATEIDVCAALITTSSYVAFVNGSTSALGMYDMLFSDANGEFPLGDGYYKTATIPLPAGSDWFRIQDGVIVEFGTCP